MHETQVSVAHCAGCQFTSEDLTLVICPHCAAVLGETVVTRRADPWWPVALHWVVVVLALVTVAVVL